MKMFLATTALAFAATAALAENPMVGGAEMFPEKTIAENASTAPNLTTLVAAVGAAGLGETLMGEGPFTVFAPTNDAFGMLPAGAVDGLLLPEAKDQLTKVLTCHVVAGEITSASLIEMIGSSDNIAKITTVGGCVIEARLVEGGVELTDETGGKAMVTQADVDQSNGVVHVIDHVLMPAM